MLEFITDPPWWVILLLGWLLPPFGWVRAQLPRLAQLPSMVSTARSATWRFLLDRMRSFFRGREKKRLQKIKAVRFHSTLINRQVAKSYAYLVLFMLSALIYFSGVVAMGMVPKEAEALKVFWMILTGPFMLVFELLWLITAGKVDSLLKYRQKIRRHGMRLV